MREPIIASKGLVLTDGITYGTIISLGDGVSEEGFYEITKEEYEQILSQNSDFKEN